MLTETIPAVNIKQCWVTSVGTAPAQPLDQTWSQQEVSSLDPVPPKPALNAAINQDTEPGPRADKYKYPDTTSSFPRQFLICDEQS